jgi:lysophospholipase L1-like esterase
MKMRRIYIPLYLRKIAVSCIVLIILMATISFSLAQSLPPTARQSGPPPGFDPGKMLASRIEAFAEQDKVNPPPTEGIVFMGSSIFEQWSNLVQHMAPLPVFNRAIGGTKTDEQLRYMDQLVLKYRPRIVVYYCGSNDVNAGSTAADIVDNFKQFVDRIAAQLPQTKIIFASINRAPQKKERWNIVDEANAAIKAYAEKGDRVVYAELNTALFDEKGNPRLDLYQGDQLHFKPAAYEEFARIIKPILQQLWGK